MQHLSANSGLGFTASSKRSIQSGAAYDGLFGVPTNTTKTLQVNPSIQDTMRHMAVMIVKHKNQTKRLYSMLRNKSKTDEEFLRNLFDFQYNHIQYKEDEKGKEQLRQPNAAWRDRKSGIDCDCFSIFTATTLMHDKNLYPVIRVVRQPSMKTFHHVYVVVPKTPDADLSIRANYWVIDPVVDRFDYEINWAEKIDLSMKDFVVQELGSVNSSSLGCPGDDCKCKEPVKHVIVSTTDMFNRLKLERELIAQGKVPNLDKYANKQQLVLALDDILANWHNEAKRMELLVKYRNILSQTASKGLNGFDVNSIFSDPNLLQTGLKAGASFLPGGGFISAGLDLLNPGAAKPSGFSSAQGSAQTVWFWKYYPGQARYGMPVIAESDSKSYRETVWRPLLERESGGVPLEQMESMFIAAMQVEPGLVNKKFASDIEKWKYIAQVAQKNSQSTFSTSSSESGLSLSNPAVKWGGIALLTLLAVGTTVYMVKS